MVVCDVEVEIWQANAQRSEVCRCRVQSWWEHPRAAKPHFRRQGPQPSLVPFPVMFRLMELDWFKSFSDVFDLGLVLQKGCQYGYTGISESPGQFWKLPLTTHTVFLFVCFVFCDFPMSLPTTHVWQRTKRQLTGRLCFIHCCLLYDLKAGYTHRAVLFI